MKHSTFPYQHTLTKVVGDILPHLRPYLADAIFVELVAGSGCLSFYLGSHADCRVSQLHVNDDHPYVSTSLRSIFTSAPSDFDIGVEAMNHPLVSGYLTEHPEVGWWGRAYRMGVDSLVTFATERNNHVLLAAVGRVLLDAAVRGTYWSSTTGDKRKVASLDLPDLWRSLSIALGDIRERSAQLDRLSPPVRAMVTDTPYAETFDLIYHDADLYHHVFFIDPPFPAPGDVRSAVFPDVSSVLTQSYRPTADGWEHPFEHQVPLRRIIEDTHARGGTVAVVCRGAVEDSRYNFLPRRIPHDVVPFPLRNRRGRAGSFGHESLVIFHQDTE